MSEVVKKVVIPQNEIPPTGKVTGKFLVRYRIISEDKNRTSHWSPNYLLETTPLGRVEHTVSKIAETNSVRAFWTPPGNLGLSLFDVYVRWNGGDWTYAVGISSTSYETAIIQGGTSFQIAVQAPTKIKKRYESATLFESNPTAL
jgi:hypothetical protein